MDRLYRILTESLLSEEISSRWLPSPLLSTPHTTHLFSISPFLSPYPHCFMFCFSSFHKFVVLLSSTSCYIGCPSKHTMQSTSGDCTRQNKSKISNKVCSYSTLFSIKSNSKMCLVYTLYVCMYIWLITDWTRVNNQ